MNLSPEMANLLHYQLTGMPITRYNWAPAPKPFFWWLTFWREKWKFPNHGQFVPVFPDEPGYNDAVYASTVIFDPKEMQRLTELGEKQCEKN